MTTQAGEAQQVWCDQADKADTAGANNHQGGDKCRQQQGQCAQATDCNT